MKKLFLMLLITGFSLNGAIPVPPTMPINPTPQDMQVYNQKLNQYYEEIAQYATAIFANDASNQVRITYQTSDGLSGDFWLLPNNKQIVMPKNLSQPACITKFAIYPYRGSSPIYDQKSVKICNKTITINKTWGTTYSQKAGADVSW